MYQSLHNVIRLNERLKKHFTKKGKKLVTGFKTKKLKSRTDLINKAKKARKDRKK